MLIAESTWQSFDGLLDVFSLLGQTLEAKKVEFQTARQIAEAQANVTIQKAIGDEHRILQNGKADAAIIEAYVEAELTAYGQIHTDLGHSKPRKGL